MIKLKPRLGWENRQLHWIQSTGFQLGGGGGGGPPLSFHPPKTICWSISDTRVFLSAYYICLGKACQGRKVKERHGK
jgi:hypothetical protein